MHLLIIALIVGMTIYFLTLTGCSQADTRTPVIDPKKPASLKKVTTPMSRKQVMERLRKIAATPPPESLQMGAMCYEIAASPNRAEYVCPTCGEKTLYASPEGGYDPTIKLLEWQLTGCRRLAKQIKGLDVKLVETTFCKSCKPKAENRQLQLVVTYKDGEPHHVDGIRTSDLQLLLEFSKGELKHKGKRDNETPLKEHLNRLHQLLGVESND